MTVSYNKLWKLLVDKKMSKADLRKTAEIAPNTLTKMRKDEPVSIDVLLRICDTLDCNIGEMMDVVRENVLMQ
ncbi:MAG: helix-turn-helix transcriptional regulator [Clostridia bacterium]|nr:helix-turn-helix transcriptional regulator [Clostridia bacterium]